jgi:hypothetical protein
LVLSWTELDNISKTFRVPRCFYIRDLRDSGDFQDHLAEAECAGDQQRAIFLVRFSFPDLNLTSEERTTFDAHDLQWIEWYLVHE